MVLNFKENIIKSTILSLLLGLFFVNGFSQCNPNAGSDIIICGHTAILSATPVNSPETGTWSTDSSNVTFADIHDPNTSVTVPFQTNTTFPFYWTVEDTTIPCSATDTMYVTFLPIPTPYAGLNQETCDQTTQLNADTTGINITTLNWTTDIPGVSISDNSIPNPNVSIAAMAPTIYGDSGQITIWFYLNVYNSQGCGNTDSVSVIFYQAPQAYAGIDDSICGLDYDLQAQFDLVNNHSQGQWSYVPSLCPAGATVDFDDDTVPTTTVHVSTYGYYSFVWSEWNRDNSACISYDTVVITFIPYPVVDCIPDFSVCGKWAELNVITANGVVGQWNAIGSASYASYNSIDSINSAYQDSTHTWVYHDTPNDTVTFYWTEYSDCAIGVDTVHVYFAGDVSAIPLIQDSTNCGLVFYGLDAQTPQYGYGYWIDTTNNTQFYDTAYTPHPDSVVVSYYGMHHFYWIVNNGTCTDTSDVVPISFYNSSTLHGYITNMNNPMDIYGYYSNHPITPVNTMHTVVSDFYMPTSTGEYIFKTAYSTPEANYPDAYYDQSFSWSTAQAVHMTCDDTIDINFTLPSITINSSGIGLLSGNIHYGGTLTPFEGASISLIDSMTGTIINNTQSDINGDYSFSQVPVGNYYLNVDIFGLQQQSTHFVNVTSTNYQFYNLNFEVDTIITTRNPVGIYADYSALGFSTKTTTNISVFPNPSSGTVYIESTNSQITGIEITDITGKTIFQSNETGNHYQIDLKDKPNGIYFVTVRTKENSFVRKVVLER